jgi:hypothetical protein
MTGEAFAKARAMFWPEKQLIRRYSAAETNLIL